MRNLKKYVWLTLLTALVVLAGSVGIARAEILPPRGEGQIGLQAVVLCETLSVRREPSADSEAVQTLRCGDVIIVQPETGGWAACFLTDSVDGERAGWVNEDYLAIDPAWYRTEEKTPVYAWNETTAPKVALLDANTALPVLKAEGEWLVVGLRGAAGWIHVQGPAAETGRRDGERFDAVIQLEGMDETVRYEHIVNRSMGIEMDYDYALFARTSEPDRERFVSLYDDPEDPLNEFEVRRYAEDAETVAAAIAAELSETYDITQEPYTLERAGSCTMIDASVVKGTNEMAEFLERVYVIPADEGCIVARSRLVIESSEGFGARIRYLMNTLALLH